MLYELADGGLIKIESCNEHFLKKDFPNRMSENLNYI